MADVKQIPVTDGEGNMQLTDGAGNKITVQRYKDRLWPPFPAECIRGVETFKSRDQDILVVAYPKSGTHWVWEMVRLLLAGTTDVPVIEKETAMIELNTAETLEAKPSPRALNTHSHFELMPREVLNKKTSKLIYVTRDPRDVAVSYYNHHRKLDTFYHYEGEWKDYFPLYLSGTVDYESWFAYTKGWEQGMKDNPDLHVHVTSYEALHENAQEEVEKLAKFLEVSKDTDLVSDIVKKTSFDVMRATKGELHKLKDKNDPGTPIMYRKGKVGDWKNWFTVAQAERFDAVFEQEMKGTKAYELYSNQKDNLA